MIGRRAGHVDHGKQHRVGYLEHTAVRFGVLSIDRRDRDDLLAWVANHADGAEHRLERVYARPRPRAIEVELDQFGVIMRRTKDFSLVEAGQLNVDRLDGMPRDLCTRVTSRRLELIVLVRSRARARDRGEDLLVVTTATQMP